MAGYFADDVVAISGAASGIGKALALELAAAGVRGLALSDLDGVALQVARSECEAAAAAAGRARAAPLAVATTCADLREAGAIERWAAEAEAVHGGVVTVLVNNAGMVSLGLFDSEPKERFDKVMAINFDAVVHSCRVFLPILKRSKRAHIANVSSMFGYFCNDNTASYHASKFAVAGFSYALHLECKADPDSNVHVSCIHPGFVRTDLMVHSAANSEQIKEEAKNAFKMVGMLNPDQCAKAILRGVADKQVRVKVGVDAHLLDYVVRLVPELYLSNRFVRGSLLGATAIQAKVTSKVRDVLDLSDGPAMVVTLAMQYALLRSLL